MRPSPSLDANVSRVKDDTVTKTTNKARKAQDGGDGIRLSDFAKPTPAPQQRLSDDDASPTISGNYNEGEKTQLVGPGVTPRPSSIGRRLSLVDDEDPPVQISPSKKIGPVSWRELPHKGQLAILTLARLSEPLTQTSLQAYMFYQLKSFDPSLPDSAIASQAGILQGSFTAAQFFTAILWGRAADSEWGGRKKVLLVGLFGTCLSCVGFGFSRSFLQAAIFRTMGGALNGNVGVMRTMISEIIKEKK